MLSIAVACLPRTPIGTHLQTTRVESLSNPDQLFAALRALHAARCWRSHCTLHAAQSNGTAARDRCHMLHRKRGPRRQQAVGRRTIREQAAARAARPRRLRPLRNDPDALERHGCAAARVVQRLDACDRGDGVPADATPSETRAIDATFSTHRSTTPSTIFIWTTPSTCTSPAAVCQMT